MVDLETGPDQAFLQLSLGEDLYQGDEPQKVPNWGDDSENPRHVANTGRTGDKYTARLESLVSGYDCRLRILEQVQEVVRHDDIVTGFQNVVIIDMVVPQLIGSFRPLFVLVQF